ncbi:translation initiation factor IF-2-like [Prionailurus viverrinus]|uniref:translation initiation factor IF-2-like n=1 Tax=Prionailurus viverrinus TaxID=61388 RepID=UPI001FF3E350|nr:translation initiation factor IF-2-like [Prionailurus viverrinus]
MPLGVHRRDLLEYLQFLYGNPSLIQALSPASTSTFSHFPGEPKGGGSQRRGGGGVGDSALSGKPRGGDPRISRGRAAAQRAGGGGRPSRSHPFLKEAPSSPPLPPPLPPPQVTAPRGDRGPAAPEQVGAAPAAPPPPPGPPGSQWGRRARLRAQPGGGARERRALQRGSGGGVLPAAGALLGSGPLRERPGRGAARPSPRGRDASVRRRRVVPAGSPPRASAEPTRLGPCRRRRSAVRRAPAPPAGCGSVPSFDRCPHPPPPSEPQAFCCREDSGQKRP